MVLPHSLICSCLDKSPAKFDEIIKAVEDDDIPTICAIGPTLNPCQVANGLFAAKNYHTFVALSKFKFNPCYIDSLYRKALIASYESLTPEERSHAMAISMHISPTTDAEQNLLINILCAVRFGKYEIFLAHSLNKNGDLLIKSDHTFIYSVACHGNCQSIIKYLESTQTIDDDDCLHLETDYIYTRCLWAAYRDDRETWIREARNLIKYGKEPHPYIWIDNHMQKDSLDKPDFIPDKWYFYQMFFDLKISMEIGYYYNYSLEFNVEWMTEFLEKNFNKDVLLKPQDNRFEYEAKWDGEAFSLYYFDYGIRDMIDDIELDIENINMYDGEKEHDLKTLKEKLAELNKKRKEIENSKFFKIYLNKEDISEYL